MSLGAENSYVNVYDMEGKLTKRDFLAIAVKVLGLAIFTESLVMLPGVIGFFSVLTRTGRTIETVYVIQVALLICIGIFLMLCAGGIARSLMRDDSTLEIPGWVSDKNVLFDVAVRVYGVVLLASGLPELLGKAMEYFQMSREGMAVPSFTAQQVTSPFVRLIIGMCLVIGISKIVGYTKGVVKGVREEIG